MEIEGSIYTLQQNGYYENEREWTKDLDWSFQGSTASCWEGRSAINFNKTIDLSGGLCFSL